MEWFQLAQRRRGRIRRHGHPSRRHAVGQVLVSSATRIRLLDSCESLLSTIARWKRHELVEDCRLQSLLFCSQKRWPDCEEWNRIVLVSAWPPQPPFGLDCG